MKNKQKLFFPVLIVIVILGIFLIKLPKQTTPPLENDTPVATVSPVTSPLVDQFEYPGTEGVDALTLLKQKTIVEQDSSGMVVSISGRQADNSQREFWSFYINGESAQVGPASYITKDSDVIIWKIEKY